MKKFFVSKTAGTTNLFMKVIFSLAALCPVFAISTAQARIVECDDGRHIRVTVVLPMEGKLSEMKQEEIAMGNKVEPVCYLQASATKLLITHYEGNKLEAGSFPMRDEDARPLDPAGQALLQLLFPQGVASSTSDARCPRQLKIGERVIVKTGTIDGDPQPEYATIVAEEADGSYDVKFDFGHLGTGYPCSALAPTTGW